MLWLGVGLVGFCFALFCWFECVSEVCLGWYVLIAD